jgi:fibronectin-binding autotransporter adhesin
MNTKSFTPMVRAAVCCIALYFLGTPLHAQTWSGNGSDALWSTGANWVGGDPPAANTTISLEFGATSKLTSTNDISNLGFGTNASTATLTFLSTAGAYVLGGQQIQKGNLIINSGSPGITLDMPLYLRNSAGRIFQTDNIGVNTINGVISSFSTSQYVQKEGTGILLLTNDNTYSGPTEISAGTLRVSKIGNATVAGNLGTNAVIQIGRQTTSGVLEYVGAGETTNRQIQIGSASALANTGSGTILSNGSGALQFSNATFNVQDLVGSPARSLTLGGANADANTISGVIRNNDNDTGKLISLVKQDSGQWILGGNNTYTGTTTVSAGTLLINGNQTTATGAVSVAAGATLGGSGTIGGATVINGILAPGNSIGTLSINNNVTWNFNTDNEWVFELGSAGDTMLSPGTSDRLSINGNFVKGTGTTFTFDFDGTGTAGWYQLVSWTGTGSSFDVSNFQATNLAGSLTGDFFLQSDGLYLQVIPEPASLGLLAMGMGLMVLLKRRQRIA